MDFKENRVTFEPGKFTMEQFTDIINSFNRNVSPTEIKFNTSIRGGEIIDLTINPTPEGAIRLKEISAEIEKEARESHWKNTELFIEKYGRVLYAFCDNISKKDNFLAYESGDYLQWDAIETGEVDEDDDFIITFNKGEFNYVKDTCSGYGNREILEKDIKKERVLQLLKK